MATATEVAAIEELAHTSSLDEKHASEESVSAGHTPDEHDIELYGENVTFPTEEEIATLRRVADKMPIGAFAIVIVELCERFAFYGVFSIHLSQFFINRHLVGLSGPFQNYLQNPLPPGSLTGAPSNGDLGTAGALNQGQTAATGLQNMFQFLAYITPIFGGMIADAKWGRYNTICVFCGVYFVGLLIILLTSIPSALSHGGGLAGWTVGAVVVAIGTGGIKSNVSPLVADQYRKTRMFIKTLPSGERVIVDPNVTITRIYNLFYWCINVGSLSSIATTELEHNVGFWAAFLLPTIVFLGTPIVLITARSTYYKVPPRGSVLIETYRVWKIALRGFWTHPIRYIRESRATGVWNRAKPSFVLGDANAKDKKGLADKNRWLTWGTFTLVLVTCHVLTVLFADDAFVDEVKRTAKACQIFLFFPVRSACNACYVFCTDLFPHSSTGSRTTRSPPTWCRWLPTCHCTVYPTTCSKTLTPLP